MHRGTHALLHCVALLSLLLSCYGNAAKGPAPAELLTTFARTVGTVYVPIIQPDQLQQQPQDPQNQTTQTPQEAPVRRQVTTSQDAIDDADDVQSTPGTTRPNLGHAGGFPFALTGANFRQPYQHQNLIYPANGAGPFDGQPDPRLHGLDPRLIQQFAGNLGQLQAGPIQQNLVKPINPLGAGLNGLGGNYKDAGINVNSIQDGNSKSGSQNNRQFDPQDFQINPQSNVGIGGGGNYNRFGSGQFGYQNVRQQSFYSDSPGGGRNNYFNDFAGGFPGGGGGYQLGNLNFNGYGSGSGLGGLGGGESYFGGGGNYFGGQSPYQSLGFGGGDGSPGGFPGGNFQSQFNGGGFPGANFPGFFPGGQGGPGGFGSGSDIRPTTAKETTSSANVQQASSSGGGDQKLRYLHAKRRNVVPEKQRSAPSITARS